MTAKQDIKPDTVYRLAGTVHEVIVRTYPELVWVDADGWVESDRPKVRLAQVEQVTGIDGGWYGHPRPFGAVGWLRDVLPRDLTEVK